MVDSSPTMREISLSITKETLKHNLHLKINEHLHNDKLRKRNNKRRDDDDDQPPKMIDERRNNIDYEIKDSLKSLSSSTHNKSDKQNQKSDKLKLKLEEEESQSYDLIILSHLLPSLPNDQSRATLINHLISSHLSFDGKLL